MTVHSARIFAGETLTLTKATGITASVEALFNLNKEGSALKYPNGTVGVDSFDDTRVNGKLGLTTTLYKRMSISFGFLLRYDQNPAPLPIPSGSPRERGLCDGVRSFRRPRRHPDLGDAGLHVPLGRVGGGRPEIDAGATARLTSGPFLLGGKVQR